MPVDNIEVLKEVPRFAGSEHYRRFSEFFIARMDLSAELRIIRKAGVVLVEIGMQDTPDPARWYRVSLNRRAAILRLGEVTEVWPMTLPEVDIHARRLQEMEQEYEEKETQLLHRQNELESELKITRTKLKITRTKLADSINSRELLGGAFNVKEKALDREVKNNQQLSVTIVNLHSQMHEMTTKLGETQKKLQSANTSRAGLIGSREKVNRTRDEAQQFLEKLKNENEVLQRTNEALMRENAALRPPRVSPEDPTGMADYYRAWSNALGL